MRAMLAVFLLCLALPMSARAQSTPAAGSADISGSVIDSATTQPLQGVEIDVLRNHQLIAKTVVDQFGKFVVHNLPAGDYDVQARVIGYRLDTRRVSIGSAGPRAELVIALVVTPLLLQEVTATAQAPVAVDTRTGDQVFQQNDFHGSPTTTTSQILQQSIAGAVRAPTGEVHIRGQHAEYTYYVDGVPVLAGISGSLNELFDPSVVNRIEFQTGGWDAEYGNKNTAIVDVHTRVPAGALHSDVSGYGGSFNSNGQSLGLSNNQGPWGWFVSGSRQVTDMRQEPVAFDPTTNTPLNFHNHGEDLFGFGKLQYLPTHHDVLNLNVSESRTKFEVPFDSTGGVSADDHQTDRNGFVDLGWRHEFTRPTTARPEAGADLFAALFVRHGSLDFVPGASDDPSFIFFPDSTPYNLSESRSFSTYGTKVDYRLRRSHDLEFKLGAQASATRGQESFNTTAADGGHGPASNSDLDGHDLGIYGQSAYSPIEWFEVRAGVRYDAHTAPFAGTQDQVSPRVKFSFFPNPANTFFAYYGRLFIPTNVEDLRAITSAADSGVVALPTLPERDDFYELGLVHRFPGGVVAKLSGYKKVSTPGIDDNTVPGSAITTSVNLDRVEILGVEAVVEVRPPGPLSGYLNFAVNHAYGRGPITGGFFPTDIADVPGGWFDLDHDQRVSAVGSAVYSAHQLYLSATGIYGSGLTNGAEITQPIGLGLLDFNRDIHVDPSFILNMSGGYSAIVGGVVVRPQVYVDNVFDHKYLLKGAFFSGASVGRPRAVQVRVSVSL